MKEDEQIKLTVRFYKTDSGNEPVRKWLQEQSIKVKKIIGADIKTVQFGWPLGMPLVDHLTSDIKEVRSNLPDKCIARVLFCTKDNQMILLHSFIKKTQKTPKQDLELAIKRYKEIKDNE